MVEQHSTTCCRQIPQRCTTSPAFASQVTSRGSSMAGLIVTSRPLSRGGISNSCCRVQCYCMFLSVPHSGSTCSPPSLPRLVEGCRQCRSTHLRSSVPPERSCYPYVVRAGNGLTRRSNTWHLVALGHPTTMTYGTWLRMRTSDRGIKWAVPLMPLLCRRCRHATCR